MAIHLLIKGNVAQATQAAHDHGISLNQIHSGANQFNELLREYTGVEP